MKPFQIADNQRDGNPVHPSISEELMTIDQNVSQMEHFYQLMLAKLHTNI